MSQSLNQTFHSKVRFESPMLTNDTTSSSEAGLPVNPHELIIPPLAMHLPNSQLGLNLGMSLPMAQPLPAPWFNFSMNLNLPTMPPPAAPLMPKFNLDMDLDLPTAPPSAAPPTPKFNFGMNLGIPATVSPSPAVHTPQSFNLGFGLTLPTQEPAPTPFNFGFNLPVQGTTEPAPKPFNLGFNLPVQGMMPLATAVPAASQPFNLGFNLPLTVPHATPPEPQGMLVMTFRMNFGCEPPALIREWQPELIRALPSPHEPLPPIPSPQSSPPVALPAAITNAAPGLSTSSLPDTVGQLKWPTLKSLVGDAECAAIDIVHHLGGEEFDHLAQMMVGGALGPGDDIWDFKPDEVIQSNKMMLMAFCESRDWLTRIFKDLISLHHLAQLHEHILPSVESLLNEVHQAEAGSGEEIDSSDDM
ncbi:hypothetical protein EDD22DRAFT_959907 [Suillus occidentalis]|nr:hypothetical protein EDD22DRAFT_959907 [Suillus occidentalis]